MKKNIKISPVGLKGNEINERMKTLMGIQPINESKSNVVVELTKVGPDGKAYAIVRENHEWYIKSTNKQTKLVAEDFKYIGGLQNKKSEAYPSYAKAIKHLNLKFKSLAEAHNFEGEINVFENDNLLSESGFAAFSNYGGNGFSGEGNNEGQEQLWEEEATDDVEPDNDVDDVELTEEEEAVESMIDKEVSEEEKEEGEEPIMEHKLTILKAMENMDAIIDSLTEGKVKKKSLHNKVNEDKKYVLKLAGSNEPATAPAAPIDDAPPADAGFGSDDAQPSSDEKPFDAEPFDAGVEADEQSDPKKFIEQLTGKLGQSLRKYNEEQGQPDFELEKFAINSLLAASHTADMDQNDQDDIIKKVKTAGKNDDNQDDNQDDNNSDDSDGGNDGDNNDNSGGSDFGGDIGDDSTDGGQDMGGVNEEKETSIFLDKPKKNNMFQPGSNDKLKEDLNMSKKSSIFGNIKDKLQETFNQEEPMNEPMIEPQVEPVVKPAPDKVQPNIAPSRKNKPFLPMPEVKPDPKASK